MAHTDVSAADPIVRKVQLAGGSTFTVSLPKEWARSQSLEAGSELRLYALEDRIVVAPAVDVPATESVTIQADDLGVDALRRRVRAAYTTGGDEIRVTATDGLSPEQRQAATEALTGLVGVEVERGGEAPLVARSMLDADAVSLEQTLRQLRRQALAMYREAIEAVLEADAALAASVERRIVEVERFVALVGRQFHAALVDVGEVERLETGRATAFRYDRTARALGEVGRDAAVVARVAREQSSPPADPVAEAITDLGAGVRSVLADALHDDPATVVQGQADVAESLAALDEALETATDSDAFRYGRLRERVAETADAIDSVATARCQAALDGTGT